MSNSADSIMPYIEDIAHRLNDPYKYGAVSIMVGAGFSKNAECIDDTKTSPPDWYQLAEEMYKKVDPVNYSNIEKKAAECSGRNVLSLAQKYEVMFDRSSLNSLIEQSISDNSFVPGNLHKELMSFNWNDVFTTNYDTFLERTINQIISRNNYKIVYSPNDLPGSVRPRIIKLHGSIGQSSDYIITEEDYRTYPITFAPFVNTVQQSMLETRLCLIGFSGDDPNFLNWVGWLRDNLTKNCLSIYLCGVFNTLSIAEKKLIEKRGITIVDLSLLLQTETGNPFHDAYQSFFDNIKSIIHQGNESILSNKPNPTDRVKYKLVEKELKEFNNQVYSYADKVINYISNYACLPNDESNELSKYFYRELEYTLSSSCEQNIEIINKYCYILYYCHCVLYDDEANKLEKIVIVSDEDYDYIIIYLLQMYRIDGENEKYQKIKSIIYNKLEKKESIIKNEYYLEFAKYHFFLFQYQEATKFINSISSTSNEIHLIKKASLLIEVNKSEEAIEILKKIKSSIIQKKYSENKLSSLLGYINLVYRAAGFLILDNNFSDRAYDTNKYNCRKILINAEEGLIKSIFLDEIKEAKQNISFRPNTYRSNITYGKQIGDDSRDNSFNYILLNDLLCLCQYSDQSDAYILATKQITLYSSNPIWKWYRIFMMGDIKKYDYYFTRVQLYKADYKCSMRFFDSILRLIEEQQKNDTMLLRKIDFKCLYNIASRFSIVVDSERIILLLNLLFSFIEKNPKHQDLDSIIDNTIRNINNSIDDDVMNYILSYDQSIIIGFDILPRIDSRTKLNPKRINSYENVIYSYMNSKDDKKRNYAIELYHFYEKSISSDYKSKIKKRLWAQTDEYGFPKNYSFLPTVWIHESRRGISSKYKNFILNPSIPHEVMAKGSFVFSGNPCREISTYYIVLRNTLIKNKCFVINDIELNNLLEYFREYLKLETELLRNKAFWFEDVSVKKFEFLVAIIYLLVLYSLKHRIKNEEMQSTINEIISICDRVNLNCYEIKSLNDNLDLYDDLKHYESYPYQKNNVDMFLSYQNIYGKISLMSAAKKRAVFPDIIEFIKSMSFIDVIYNNKWFLNTAFLIEFIPKRESSIKSIIDFLEKCYDRYILLLDDEQTYERSKAYLDGMYNISNFAMDLYLWIKDNDDIVKLFYSFAAKLKENKLNEIRNPWRNLF